MATVTPLSESELGLGKPKRKGGNVTPMRLPDLPESFEKSASPKAEVPSAPQGAGVSLPLPLSSGNPGRPSFSEEEKTAMPVGRPLDTLWNARGASPVVMAKALIDQYGHAWLSWEPETLRKEIIEDFSTTLSNLSFDKIMAIKTCHLTQSPWREWDVFQNVCLAFNDVPVDFEYFQSVSPGQMAYAIQQMNLIRKEEFDDDIKAYIATRCHTKGLVYLPEPIHIAQEYLDKLNTPAEDFKKIIQDIWITLQNKNLRTWDFKDDMLGVQLSNLARIKLYVDYKMQTSAEVK